MITLDTVQSILNDHCLVTEVTGLLRGHIRLGTKLAYLDGSGVDVFVEGGPLRREHGYALSDLGQTLAKLAEYQIKPRDRAEMIREAVGGLRVRQTDDRLIVELEREDELEQWVIDLAQ